MLLPYYRNKWQFSIYPRHVIEKDYSGICQRSVQFTLPSYWEIGRPLTVSVPPLASALYRDNHQVDGEGGGGWNSRSWWGGGGCSDLWDSMEGRKETTHPPRFLSLPFLSSLLLPVHCFLPPIFCLLYPAPCILPTISWLLYSDFYLPPISCPLYPAFHILTPIFWLLPASYILPTSYCLLCST
jgi:hypothetical protein